MPRMAEKIAGTFQPEDKTGKHRKSIGEMPVKHRIRRISYIPPNAVKTSSTSIPQDISHVEPISEEEWVEVDEVQSPTFIEVIQEANMDGVHHLKSEGWTRYMWIAVLALFLLLSIIQIHAQVVRYLSNPIATNVEVEYPSRIVFPTIAICNNNQYRLTYITNGHVLKRRAPNIPPAGLKSVDANATTVFDKVILHTWDMDSVKFLRNSAHWKSRMILGCTWPNGTSCKLSNFKAVWTPSGLCWAINTNVHQPYEVTGSGPNHGLKLLLNVESYERVDACSKRFRSRALPGLKILIYNQTDSASSSMGAVNVPSGYAMDIPIKMQHRNRIHGYNCIDETEDHIRARDDFDSPQNLRTCTIRKYLRRIEEICRCSMKRAFHPDGELRMKTCTVDEYFGCVQPATERIRDEGATECQPSCDSVDFTAWQDMNRLPQNLMPTLIEDREAEDEEDGSDFNGDVEDETFACENDGILSDDQVMRIKRDANRAFEMQSRHQEDIFLKTKRLIVRFKNAVNNITEYKFGWHNEDFVSVYQRLSDGAECFANFSKNHEEIATIMKNRPPLSEEKRSSQIHLLVDPDSHARQANRYKTIGDVKSHYGDRVETVLKQIQLILETVEMMWKLFDDSTYHVGITTDLQRMDQIIEFIKDYESGRVQRRVWGEKMTARHMKHFFDEDFYDGWYQPLHQDLDQSLNKVISLLEEKKWKEFENEMVNASGITTGSVLFFENTAPENLEKFGLFVNDVYGCIIEEVKPVAVEILKDFKRMFRELQNAYTKLFKEDLKEYLENYQFGAKFVGDNFAMVNIFLHKMHIERWSQDRTYGFWSLASDVGGTLGLFLGISLLTLIEIVYICFQYGSMPERFKAFSLSSFIAEKKWKKSFRRYADSKSKSEDLSKNSRGSYEPVPRNNSQNESTKKSIWIDDEPIDLAHKYKQQLAELDKSYESEGEKPRFSLDGRSNEWLSDIAEEKNSSNGSGARRKKSQSKENSRSRSGTSGEPFRKISSTSAGDVPRRKRSVFDSPQRETPLLPTYSQEETEYDDEEAPDLVLTVDEEPESEPISDFVGQPLFCGKAEKQTRI